MRARLELVTSPANVANQTVQVNILLQQVDPPPEYENAGPIITSLVVSRSSVELGGFVDVQATARDPNGDVITFAWTATGGSFDNAASPSARWTAPSVEGSYTLTLTVSDPHGASTSRSFSVRWQSFSPA